MWTDTEIAAESSRPLCPGGTQVQPGRRRRTMTALKMCMENALKAKRIVLTVLTVLVVLAILAVAGYFVKKLIDSKYFFCTKSFKFIPLEKACDGTEDCSGAEDESTCVSSLTVNNTFPVRLVSSSQVLQVYRPGSGWRTVCADDWSTQHTETTCRQLGSSVNPGMSKVDVSVLPVDFRASFCGVRRNLGAASTIQQDVYYRRSCSSGTVVSLTCSGKHFLPASPAYLLLPLSTDPDPPLSSPLTGSLWKCGDRPSQDRVVGGTQATIEDWPWQVSLQQNGQHTCGGSLVSSRWVVTAAHCSSGKKELSRWKVWTGRTNMMTWAIGGSSVDKIIMNGEYNAEHNDYDIAMMRLSNPITFGDTQQPVCLPPYGLNLKMGTPLVVTGWGYTAEKGDVSSVLQKATLPLIDKSVCSSPDVYGSVITSRMLCAGYLDGHVDACQGDSGGPLVYLSRRWQLVGVVSWGVGCARKNTPGVYCNVDNVLNWIYTVMEKNS